jgi:hypothetical protein
VRAQWEASVVQQREAAASAAVEQERKNAEAADGYAKRIKAADARAAATGTVLAGVQQRLAAVSTAAAGGPDDSCKPEREQLATLSGLLGEGAGLVAEGAGLVEQLDAQVTGLQQVQK